MDLFGTAGVRGPVATRVTPSLATAVGRAAGAEARETGARTVVVGRDGRTTGPALAAAAEAGLLSAGVDVVRAGVLPTPALAFASRGRHGLMVTASHNPPTDNGLKLFVDGVEYDRDRERAVERRVDDEGLAPWDEFGTTRTASPLSDYRAAVAGYVRAFGGDATPGGADATTAVAGDHVGDADAADAAGARDDGASRDATDGGVLDGLRVAVDCGNGVGATATPQVLDRLGARVAAINANVDGTFPGRESKPTEASLSDLRAFVADADDVAFGAGHDGDADRVAVVDPEGEVVHEDTVVAILAERAVRAADVADPVVVTTPNASGRIDERVAAAGGRVERVRLGALHEGIAAARADGADVVYAAEPWKHVHPRLGGWIDGVATVALLARSVADAADPGTGGATGADGLATLRAPVTERPYRKADVACPDDAKPAAMDGVADRLPDAFPDADVATDYGVRLSFTDGSWLLVRPSGTEPYLRVYAEADDVDALLDAAREAARAAVDDAAG